MSGRPRSSTTRSGRRRAAASRAAPARRRPHDHVPVALEVLLHDLGDARLVLDDQDAGLAGHAAHLTRRPAPSARGSLGGRLCQSGSMHDVRKEVPCPISGCTATPGSSPSSSPSSASSRSARPRHPSLSDEPATFDGGRAMLDLTTLAEEYPGTGRRLRRRRARRDLAGRDARAPGPRDAHRPFTADARRRGRRAAERLGGRSGRAARHDRHRRQPRLAAALDTGRRRERLGDGDAPRARARLHRDRPRAHPALPLDRRRRLRRARRARLRRSARDRRRDRRASPCAGRRAATADGLALDGWSPAGLGRRRPGSGCSPARRPRAANLEATCRACATQVLRLAVPTSSGSQAPFVAAGLPAHLAQRGRPAPSTRPRTPSTRSRPRVLADVGRTAETMIMAIDGGRATRPGSGGTIFLRRAPDAARRLAQRCCSSPSSHPSPPSRSTSSPSAAGGACGCRGAWAAARPAHRALVRRHRHRLPLEPPGSSPAQPRCGDPPGVGSRR